jgi:hypothetical protein
MGTGESADFCRESRGVLVFPSGGLHKSASFGVASGEKNHLREGIL